MRGSTRAHAAVIVALLGLASLVAAHDLGVESWLRDGVVRLECYFDDDTAAADALVVVRDEARNLVAKGRTDSKGVWSFPAPPAALYRVTVDAGAGHQITIRLRIDRNAEQMTPPPSPAESVPERPTPAEFTRFPWGGVALGVTVIALLFLGWSGLRSWRRRGSDAPRSDEAALPTSGSFPTPQRESP